MTSVNRLLWTAAVASMVAALVACAAPEDTTAEPAAAEAVATTPASSPSPSASPAPKTPPKVEKRTVVERQAIRFPRTTVKDPTLASGTSNVRTRGVNGVKTLTYEVVLTDGVQTAKKLVRSAVTKRPVTQVTAIGTKQQQQQSRCNTNYSGCVPTASDVDCAGGSGNGPEYVVGPVKVIGSDVYGLDNDKDGYGCED